MRFSVTHATAYRYDVPVRLEPHVVRLRPRSDGTQRLDHFEMTVKPAPAGRSECSDQDGNSVTQVWFEAPVERLQVETRFEVETLRDNAFDFLPDAAAALVNPFSYAEPWRTLLAPYSSAADIPPAVAQFAQETARAAGERTMPFLAALSRSLSEGWRQTVRPEGIPYPSRVTLDSREGSCRDLAVLFCDACRSLGLAARFVSGYERATAEHDHPYMHAWAEVYLPGGGWRGYDPSRGLAVTANHIAVAAAAVPELAAPISGTYRGSTKAHMEVAILMHVE